MDCEDNSRIMQPFLGGLTFKFDGLDEEEREYLSDWLTEAGGKLVSTDFQGEVDYLVTPCTGGSSGHRFKKHLSLIWLMDCLDQGELLDVTYYHQIIQVDKELKPLEGVVTGISGYFGRERQFLNWVVESLGGFPQEIFAKRENKEKGARGSTHLICPGVDKMVRKEKYKAALKWEIPVINADWLRACVREKKWVSESPFLVGLTVMFTPNKPMPEVMVVTESTAVEDKTEMYNIKSNISENISEMKIDWKKRFGNEDRETEIKPINREQEDVIKKLEGVRQVLNLLRSIQVKNEECFVNIKKSVDDLLSSLKFLPTEPSFNILPMEIKTQILGYLCDSGALVASSVCREWREIFKKYRLKQVKELTIGKHCSNEYQCQDTKCFMPQEVLEASVSLGLDVPLTFCHPLTGLKDIDMNSIIEGLTSVSNLTIDGGCSCVAKDHYVDEYEPRLLKNKFNQLFDELEKKSKPMESLILRNLYHFHMNQSRLIHCITTTTRRLTLQQSDSFIMVDDENLFFKLSTLPRYSKLLQLNLEYLEYDDDMSEDAADALCNVFSVKIGPQFYLNPDMVNRIIENICDRTVKIAYLDIEQHIDWSSNISPEDFKTVIQKMRGLEFSGIFTSEQVEAAQSIPGVEASSVRISKSSKSWPVVVKNNRLIH